MDIDKEFEKWFNDSPLKDVCTDSMKDMMKLAYNKGAELVTTTTLNFLIGDKE